MRRYGTPSHASQLKIIAGRVTRPSGETVISHLHRAIFWPKRDTESIDWPIESEN